jgi:predicted secreted protein
MRFGLRVVGLAAVLFLLLPLGAGLTGVASPPATDASASAPAASPAGMAVLAPVLFCLLVAAVLSWMIARSSLSGWPLVGAVFLAYFGLGTFMFQIESVVFLPRHLPPGFVNRLFAMGAAMGLVAAPAAVWIHRRFRPSPVEGQVPSGIPAAPGEWTLRLAWLAAAYVVLYFLAGHFIAYRNPDVVAYYDDSNVGSFPAQMLKLWRTAPWLFAFQALRGVLWVACVVPFIVSFRGRPWELPLLVGCAFSVWLVMLLVPNPYMPESVRMSHLVETASSNFVFGCIVGASFARPRERGSFAAAPTGA